MKYKYAKVPISYAEQLGVLGIRQKTASGDVIINEGDALCFGKPGESFEEKVKKMGGTILNNFTAKQELKK